MKRRAFISLLAGAASAWPLATRAQQPDRVRHVAMLMGGPAANDAIAQSEVAALERALVELGWRTGRNVQFTYRWPGPDIERVRTFAKEIVGLDPDVILSRTTPATVALKAQTRTIPIVFALVTEPIETGLVESFARPGGNITGFTNLEGSMGSKWIELLKEAVPGVARMAVLFNPGSAPYAGLILRSARAAATSLAVELVVSPVRDDAEIEAAITAVARRPGGGLVGIADSFLNTRRELIVALAARRSLPAIYANRYLVASGGLMSYGVDNVDLLRRAGSYVDRILKGAKPADLPVQAPTKFELVINLKTAKALGIEVPPMLLARADEVIE